MILPNADPVNKISIIPRGIAALGYTQQLPTEDRYLMTREELLGRLQVLLGGRVAEELVFGDVSTGAMNDLQRATDIARSMVTEYGMSDRLGPLTYNREPRSAFLDLGVGQRTREYSEQTAESIDEEITRIIEETYQQARSILRGRKETLDRLARILLEKESIEGDELKAFIAGVKAAQGARELPHIATSIGGDI